MGPLKRVRLRRILLLVLLAVAVGSAVYVFALRPEPGLYLELRLLRDGVDESPLLDRGDVVWCVFAEAVAPPTFKDDTVKLVWNCFKGRGAVKIPHEALKPVAEGWDRVSRDRGIDPSTFTFGLIARVVVGNASSGNVLYAATDSIPLNPAMLLQARAWRVELKLRRGSLLIESETRETLVTPKLAQPAAAEAEGGAQPTQTGYYKFVPLYIFRPENATSTLPSDYFTEYNGKKYMMTPVYILNNQGTAKMTGSVSVLIQYTIAFKINIGTGDILSKLASGNLPSITLYVGGNVWGSKVSFNAGVGTCANSAMWIYVYGRPRLIVGKMYYCVGSSCQWIYDEVDAYVEDVIVSNNCIQGGVKEGLPHSLIMNAFLYGTQEKQLSNLPGTSLADGKLDPGEMVQYAEILQTQYSNLYIGLAVPVGAIAAHIVCSPIGTPACTAFLSAFSSFFVYQETIHIGGSLANAGYSNGCGENKSVYVYVRESIYQYNVGGTTIKPPLGIYFRAQNASP